MTIFRRAAVAILTAAALLIPTLAASPAAAAPASSPSSAVAAQPPAGCVNNAGCFYVKYSFQTSEGYEFAYARTAGTCVNLTHRNKVTSLYNNSGRTFRVHKNASCGGDYLTYYNGQSSANLFFSHPTFQDNIESVRWM